MSWAGGVGVGVWIVMAVMLATVWLLVWLVVEAVIGGRRLGIRSPGIGPLRSLEQALASGAITASEFERRRATLLTRQ